MSVQVRRRREAASFLASFTGAQAELIVDTTNNRVQIHDGVTPGGWPAAKLGEVVLAAEIGAANGVAALDSTGHIPVGQIPPAIASPLVYQGTWNAATNTPVLAPGTGTKSYAYKVAVAGTTAIDSWSNWEVGDWIIFDGTTWDRIAAAEHLLSTDITDSTATGRAILTAASNASARSAVSAAASGANLDITSLSALTTPLSVAQGGTGGGTASLARTALSAAASGSNADITSMAALTSVNSGPLAGLRNLIINGNFAINQRGYTSGASLASGTYAHDRWKNEGGSAISYTFSQAAQTEQQTTASIDTTIILASGAFLGQTIEHFNNPGGLFTLSWSGSATGYIYYFAGTTLTGLGQSAANKVSVTIPAGTTIYLQFSNGTLSNAQLELGPVATLFERRPLAIELALCQRYYWQDSAIYVAALISAIAISNPRYPVTMRAVPTIAGGGSGFTVVLNTVGGCCIYQTSTAAQALTFSAEL